MNNSFSDPDKMSGLLDPMEKPEVDPNQPRSWGTAGKDWALQAAEPIAGWLRSGTNVARAAEERAREAYPETMRSVDQTLGRTPEESKVPLMEAPDKYLGHLQEEMKGAISPRGQEILSRKWLPEHYEDPRATDEPLTTMFNQAVVPLAPQLALGYATRGKSLAGKLAGNAMFGAIGAGEAANKVRDYADNTPMPELLKYEPVQQLNREFNGDEQAIRTALFHRSVDLVSELTNAGANMVTFGAVQHALTKTGGTQRPFVDLMKNMLWGTAEGATAGMAIGSSAEYGKQRMEMNVGKRQAIDTGPIWHEGMETAMGLAPVVGGMHVMRGRERPEAKETPPPKQDPVNRTPGGIDPGIAATADVQINPPTTPPAGAPPPPPPGAGAAGAPPPPEAAVNTGAPPVQPNVTVNPPAGRTPPVTPAPTPPTPAAASASPPPTAAAPPPTIPSPSQAAPGAAPYPQVVHNGVTLNIMPGPTQLHNGIVYQKVSPAGPDQATYVPVAELTPVTSGVAPAAAVAPSPAAGTPPPSAAPASTVVGEAQPAPAAGGGARAKVQAIREKAAAAQGKVPEPAPVNTAIVPEGQEQGEGGEPRVGARARETADVAGFHLEPLEAGQPATWHSNIGPLKVEILDGPTNGRYKVHIPVQDGVRQRGEGWVPAETVHEVPREPPAAPAAEAPREAPAEGGGEAEAVRRQVSAEESQRRDKAVQDLRDREAAKDAADEAETKRRIAEGEAETRRLIEAGDMEGLKKRQEEAQAKLSEPLVKPEVPTEPVRVEGEVPPEPPPHPEPPPEEAAKEPPKPTTKPAPTEGEPKPAPQEERPSARTFRRDDVVTPEKGNKYTVTRVTERPAYPQDPLVRIRMEGADREHEMRASEVDKYLHAKSIVRAEQGTPTKSGKPRERAEPLLIQKAPAVAAGERKPPLHHANYEFIGLNSSGRELWQNPTTGLRIQKWIEKNANGKPVRSATKIETPEAMKPERGLDKRYVRPDDFLLPGEQPVRPRPVERLFRHLPETTQPSAIEARRLQYAKEETARRERGEPARQDPQDVAIAEQLKKFADAAAREERERADNVRRFSDKVAEITRVKTRKGKEFTGYERALDISMNAFTHTPSQARYNDLVQRARRADAKRVAAGLDPIWNERLATARDAASAVVRDVTPKKAKEIVHKFTDPDEQDVLNGINRLVRDAETPRRETKVVREEATAASLGGVRIADREVRMNDEAFNRRQAALLKEAQKLDLRRVRAGQEAYLEDMVPPPKVLDRTTAEQAFHQILRNMERGKDLSPRDFMKSKYLTDRLNDLLRIANEQVPLGNLFQKAMAERRGMVLPGWLKDKVFGSRDTAADKYKTMFQTKEQRAYDSAKDFSDLLAQFAKPTVGPPKGYREVVAPTKVELTEKRKKLTRQQEVTAPPTVDIIDKWGLSWLLTPAVSERAKTLLKQITDREQAPLKLDEKLKKAITDEFGKRNEVGTIDDAIARAKYILDKQNADEGNASRQADFREGMFGQREGIADFGLRRTIADMFGDEKGNADPAKVGKFISTLFGQMERETRLIKKVDPETGELKETEQVLYSQLKRPTMPEYLSKRVKARGFGAARGKESTLAEGERKRFDKEIKAYTQRLNRWRESVVRQMEATEQLRKLLQGVVSRIKLETDNYTKTRGIKPTGTIRWHLPAGIERATSPYLDFTLGKDQERFQNYAFANEVQRLLNHLDVDLKLMNDKINSVAGRREDPADEYRRVATKLAPLVREFAGKLHAYLEGNMEAIGEMRKEGNVGVTHMFNVLSANKATEGGEHIDITENISADKEPSAVHDQMLQNLIDKQQASIDATKLREEQTKSNRTMEEKAADAAAELRKQFPLRSDLVKGRRGSAGFDDHGFPLGRTDLGGDLLHRDHDFEDAYTEIMTSPEPSHPLITEPETVHDTMDRVRDLITSGHVEDLPLKYINDGFLERLSMIAGDTKVQHAPYEAISGREHGTSSAWHFPEHDSIFLSHDVEASRYVRDAIHETTHAATENLLSTDPVFRGRLDSLITEARKYATDMGLIREDGTAPLWLYGLTSASEMLSESASSQRFRDFLEKVPSKEKTIRGNSAMQAMYRSVRDAYREKMGIEDADTALDVLYSSQSNVLGKVDALFENALKRQETVGRPKYAGPFRDYDERPGAKPLIMRGSAGVAPPERERREQGAISALNSHLRSYAGKTLAEAVDAGRAMAARPRTAAGGMNRGAGLPLHTTFDMTQRTSDPVFRDHAQGLYEMMRRTRAEADRILNQEDGPILEKVGTFYQTLSPAKKTEFSNFVDEVNYHNAYPNAPLYERDAKGKRIGLNKHVGEDMAWEQVRQQHDYMQKRWADMNRNPAFEDMFKTVTGFYAQKEKQIKSLLVRAFTEMNGLMPEGLDPASKQYGHLLNALEKHINHEKGTLSPEELKALDLVDIENDAKLKQKIADIRSIDELKQLAGPYFPMVRNGNFATFGRFNLPVGEGIIRPADEIEARNGKPVDNGIRMSDDIGKLKKYVKDITEKFGVTQTDGGIHYVDPKTNERLKRYTPEELKAANEKRKLAGEKPLKDNYATKGDIEDMRNEGKSIKERYWVQFSPKLLEKHDSRYDANKSIDQWRSRFDENELKITPPEPAHKGTGRQSEQWMSAGLQRMIKSVKEHEPYTDMEKHQQSQMTDLMNFVAQKMVMHRGVRQRYLPRGFVMGASKDFMQAMADYSGSAANYQARMKFQPEITRRWSALADYNEAHRYDHGDRDAEARLRITEAIGAKLHKVSEPMIDNMLNRNVDRLTRWTMLAKLPGFSYAAQNLTEVGLLLTPLMIGRHGVIKTFSSIKEAYGLASPARMLFNSARDMATAALGGKLSRNYRKELEGRVLGHRYGAGLTDLVKYMTETGLYDPHAGVEYQRELGRQRGTGLVATTDKFSDYLADIFQAGNTGLENLNRFTTGTAAYIAERDRLGNVEGAHEKAMRYAWEMVHKTNGVYANDNKPELFQRGPFMKMFTQFKQYPQRIMANYVSAAMGALKLANRETWENPALLAEAKEKARQLAAMLIMQGAAAGALGLPTEVFTVPINALNMLGLINFNADDARQGFRRWAAHQWGNGAGEMVSMGVLRGLTGIDVQPKISQSDMIFFGSPKSNKVQDLQSGALAFLGGAGGGQIFNLVSAVQKGAQAKQAWDDGNYTLADRLARESARLAVPFRGIADMLAASTQSTPEGMQSPSGKQYAQPLRGGEIATRMFGFNPVRVANEQEAQRARSRMEQRYKDERARYTREFSTAGNPAEQQRVWTRVQAWNQGQPDELKLTYSQLVKSTGTRVKQTQGKQNKFDRAFAPDLQVYQ